ncbi:FecCD family ABC transporter permease [Thermophilibacter provencensis]|uniref:Iron ABC transporter permease n=1 Tax=Thermophilibacter provencensis TaxID=1852386 RepID=A0A921KMN4_9ACTN|nr:iron ABC transporter permease [Thermophilibacter provencensis]HJF44966.1 iron ABC transporter permease [Thermophilibacter provencensis]
MGNAKVSGGGRRWRATAYDLIVLLGLLALFAANLCLGSVGTSPAEVLGILLSGPGDTSTAAQVIWQIRLPRVIEAALLGGALSLSGFLLQTFFNNPIADPFVLGVSSGAKLAVAVVMIVVLGAGQPMSPAASVGAAFLGSLLTMGFVLLISRRVRSQGMLIVAGVMVGYICSAATNFLVAFADDQAIVNLDNWSRGSFSGATWPDAGIIAAAVVAMAAAVFALSKPLGAYQLGEPYAQSVGVNVLGLRMLIVLVSSLLSACVAAFAGPVSFVGIAAPHLARRGVGSSRPLLVTPACFLTGAAFCCGCDLVARTLFSPVELSVSAVTAVFGAPIVIALMLRGRAGR